MAILFKIFIMIHCKSYSSIMARMIQALRAAKIQTHHNLCYVHCLSCTLSKHIQTSNYNKSHTQILHVTEHSQPKKCETANLTYNENSDTTHCMLRLMGTTKKLYSARYYIPRGGNNFLNMILWNSHKCKQLHVTGTQEGPRKYLSFISIQKSKRIYF